MGADLFVAWVQGAHLATEHVWQSREAMWGGHAQSTWRAHVGSMHEERCSRQRGMTACWHRHWLTQGLCMLAGIAASLDFRGKPFVPRRHGSFDGAGAVTRSGDSSS